ncbi:MAG: hypothetical protein ACFE9S_06170 [Candidatus Hermodarchaeota archaeon]
MKFCKFTLEGLPIDSNLWIDTDEKKIAAMSAAILHISTKFIHQYALGDIKRVVIDVGDEELVLSKQEEHGILSFFKKDNESGMLKQIP